MKSFMTLIAAITLFLVTGCGGGGGGGSPAGTSSSSTVSGVAATGAPFAGLVTLKDATGAVKATSASAVDGSFAIDVTGLTPPYFLQAANATGTTTLYSMTTTAGTANINPLSHLIVVAAALNIDTAIKNPADVFADPVKFKSITGTQIKGAITTVTSKLSLAFKAQMQTQGVTNVDPIADPYVIGNGLDKTFDALSLKLDPVAGTITEKNIQTGVISTVATVADLKPTATPGTGGGTTTVSTSPLMYVMTDTLNTNGAFVSIIDSTTDTVTGTIPLTFSPVLNLLPIRELTVNVAGTRLYIADSLNNKIVVIDTATKAVIATIAVGNNPRFVAVNPLGTRIYVSNGSGDTVSVIDAATNTIITNVPIPSPADLVVSPDGTRLYVANGASFQSAISVIDTTSNAVITTMKPQNILDMNFPIFALPGNMALNPAGTRLYVTSSLGLFVMNTTTNSVIGSIAVGSMPAHIAVNPAGTRAYVSNNGSGTVSVIDTATNTVIDTILAGTKPSGIVLNAAGTKAYVSNMGYDPSISVIDTKTDTVAAKVAIQGYPRDLAR